MNPTSISYSLQLDYPLGEMRLNFFLVLTVRALREGEVVSWLELSFIYEASCMLSMMVER